VAESVDAQASGACALRGVEVQVLSAALIITVRLPRTKACARRRQGKSDPLEVVSPVNALAANVRPSSLQAHSVKCIMPICTVSVNPRPRRTGRDTLPCRHIWLALEGPRRATGNRPGVISLTSPAYFALHAAAAATGMRSFASIDPGTRRRTSLTARAPARGHRGGCEASRTDGGHRARSSACRADATEPERDDGGVDVGVQEAHRRGVTQQTGGVARSAISPTARFRHRDSR
jgi:hypothetical protein